jgi:manganese transport protein
LNVVHLDLSLSYILTYVVSTCLYIAGATILFQNGLHPQGLLLVETLSTLFTETLGSGAYYLFLISAFAILLSSIIGVVEGLSHALREYMFLTWPAAQEKIKPKVIITIFSILALVIPVAFLLFVERPIWLLLVSSMMFAPAIGIIFLVSAFLCLRLPKPLRPHPLLIAISIGTALTMITTSFWNILS